MTEMPIHADGRTTFETFGEAVQRLIVDPIEASETVEDAWDEFDVGRIAHEVIEEASRSRKAPLYRQIPDVDESRFWEIVERNAL
jgi:hypothetical protein